MISVARWSPCASSPTRRLACGGQPAYFQQFPDPLIDHLVGLVRLPHPQPKAARHLDGDLQIFPDRQLRKHFGDLKGAGDAAPHPARRQQTGNVFAIENDLTGGLPEKAADQVEERRLAGAVRADHGAQFAGFDRHRDVVDGDQAAEMFRDVLDPQQAHVVAFRRMMPSTPRGKNSTISTKNRPTNDIQFSVWLEM